MDLRYFSGEAQLAFRTVILTGSARSGKTILGNILGACEHAEHIDESWLLGQLPALVGSGAIAEPLGISLFQTYAYEQLAGRMLMREASFRPTDRSFIGAQKPTDEIVRRLIHFQSRADVGRHLAAHAVTLVLTLPDTVPFCDFFAKAMPGCAIVHVARNGFAVAASVRDKHWFADEELRRPQHTYLCRQFTDSRGVWHLPYWIADGDEAAFLQFTEYSRGLYYWRRLMEMGLRASRAVPPGRLHVLTYDALVDDARAVAGGLADTLGLTRTRITENLIEKVVPGGDGAVAPAPDADPAERDAVAALCRTLGLTQH